MKEKDSISKSMPYFESEDYIDALVFRVTNKAVEEAAVKKRSFSGTLWIAASVAAAVLLLFVFIGKERADSPIDKYFTTLSYDELMQLTCCEIDEFETGIVIYNTEDYL